MALIPKEFWNRLIQLDNIFLTIIKKYITFEQGNEKLLVLWLYPDAIEWKRSDIGIKEVEIKKIIALNRLDIDEERILRINKLIENQDFKRIETAESGIYLIEFERQYFINPGGNHRVIALQDAV